MSGTDLLYGAIRDMPSPVLTSGMVLPAATSTSRTSYRSSSKCYCRPASPAITLRAPYALSGVLAETREAVEKMYAGVRSGCTHIAYGVQCPVLTKLRTV
eukprot:3603305-Rhodomonas_salina.1